MNVNIKPVDIAYVQYQHPDLDLAVEFLQDFGFTVAQKCDRKIYLRGENSSPYLYVVEKGESARFIGFGLEVLNNNNLKAIANLEQASQVYELDAPGGGYAVTLNDPNNFKIDLVCGIQKSERTDLEVNPLLFNSPTEKKRLNKPQKLRQQPAKIIRLGHIALDVLDFARSHEWYTNLLGMLTSDQVYYGHPSYPIAAFLRCNNGKNFVDHHTIAISQSQSARIHHVGCEVRDFDDIQIGHQWLKNKKYKHVWGVGRHLLGSQIFDYWQDPFGSLIEHFSDGDVFDADFPTTTHPGDLDILFQWGGPVPQTFLG